MSTMVEHAAAAASQAPGSRVRFGDGRFVTPVLIVLAGLLWWFATRSIQLDAMNSTGLVSVVGWQYVAALVCIALAAGYELTRSRVSHGSMAAIAAVLVVILFGLLNVADSHASLSTGWLHVGFSRYIDEHGAGLRHFDARFSWPGFFTASAVVAKMAGWPDPAPLMLWAPVVYNALSIPPLLLIARRVCRSDRIAWLGVLLYFCGNWYEQDYYSPQATDFLLYLTVLAVLLTLTGNAEQPVPAGPARGGTQSAQPAGIGRRFLAVASFLPARQPGMTARSAVALEGCLVVVVAAMVVAHQLTPVSLVVTLLVLTVTGSTRYRGLWLLAVLMFLLWFSYGALDYWSGHLNTITGSLGRVGSTLQSSVGSKVVKGNLTYQRGQYLRILVSLLFAVAAAAGLWRLRRRPDILLWAAMAYSAFSVVLLQSYGGEVVIRSFVFAMPLLAPLTA